MGFIAFPVKLEGSCVTERLQGMMFVLGPSVGLAALLTALRWISFWVWGWACLQGGVMQKMKKERKKEKNHVPSTTSWEVNVHRERQLVEVSKGFSLQVLFVCLFLKHIH